MGGEKKTNHSSLELLFSAQAPHGASEKEKIYSASQISRLVLAMAREAERNLLRTNIYAATCTAAR